VTSIIPSYVNYKSVIVTASLNTDSNSTYNEKLLLVTPEYNFDLDGGFADKVRPLDVYLQ
jgi:hypothetical protein